MAIITISRELGSEGDQIADFLCEELGYCRLDKALLAQLAQEAGVDPDDIVELEQGVTRRARLVSAEMTSLYRKQASAFEKQYAVEEVTYAQVVKQTMERFAQQGDALIIGRGGQMVLQAWPTALHVRLYAPLEVRVQRLAAREKISEAQARRRIERSDERRRQYIRRMHNNADWRNLKYYHLAIDTSRISPALAAQMITMAADGIDSQQSVPEASLSEQYACA